MMVKACRELNATRIQCFCHVLHSSINIDIESSSSGCINRDSNGAGSKSMTVLGACGKLVVEKVVVVVAMC